MTQENTSGTGIWPEHRGIEVVRRLMPGRAGKSALDMPARVWT